MITPLKKHPGQHGGLIALSLLAVTTIVVLTSRPSHAPRPTPAPPPVAPTPTPAPAAAMPAPAPVVAAAVVDPHAPVTASGTTDYDESRTSHVGVPVYGWVKKTHASLLGRAARSGDTLAVVYSPDVLLASASVVEQVQDYRGQAALDAARRRLLRWGMLQPALTRIEKTQIPRVSLPLLARVSGTVVVETGTPAQLVDPAIAPDLYTITDPTYIWVYVDVPDATAARIKVGTPASLAIEGIVRPVQAKVAYVYRYAYEGMRKVRFELHVGRPIKPNLPVKAVFQL